MRTRSSARLVSLAALLPLLVVTVSGFGYDRFRCTFTGQVSEAGCCPAADPSGDPPATPVADAASCCDHESGHASRLPAEASTASVALDLVAPAPTFSTPIAPRAVTIAPYARAHAPPPPPLVLLKQSFLI